MNLFNLEAEYAVIGSLCVDGQCFDDVSSIVSKSDFYNQDCAAAFAAFESVIDSGQQPEIYTVADHLEKRSGSEWLKFLATLAKEMPGTMFVKTYASKVAEYARLRELFLAGGKVQQIAMDAEQSLHDRISTAQGVLLELEAEKAKRGPIAISELAKGFIEHLEDCYLSKGGITGLPTGFYNIDQRIGGLKPGALIVIAARPAMGKTQMALNIARHVGIIKKQRCLYFSLEMTSNELLGRFTSDLADVDYEQVQTAAFDETHNKPDCWPTITAAIGRFREGQVLIDDESSLSISQIVSHVRKEHRKSPLSLVVVDHLGLVDAEGDNETQRIGKVSRGLKRLAKQLNIPVIALCQLSRKCDERSDRRPMLSDLRNSGDIEQDADIVGFIYRDVVYNEDTRHPDIGELVWRKVRGGRIGTDFFRTQFDKCRFVSMDQPYDYSTAPAKRKRAAL